MLLNIMSLAMQTRYCTSVIHKSTNVRITREIKTSKIVSKNIFKELIFFLFILIYM